MNRVTIVGMGMGNPDTLTVGAWNALREARQIIGAGRLLDALPEGCTAQRTAAVRPGDIAAALREFPACVVMSGDTGFHSGTRNLLPLLAAYDVTVLPGITTVQYFAAGCSVRGRTCAWSAPTATTATWWPRCSPARRPFSSPAAM